MEFHRVRVISIYIILASIQILLGLILESVSVQKWLQKIFCWNLQFSFPDILFWILVILVSAVKQILCMLTKKILLWHSYPHWVYVTPDHMALFVTIGFILGTKTRLAYSGNLLHPFSFPLWWNTFTMTFEPPNNSNSMLVICSSQNYKLYKRNSTSCTWLYHIWCPIFTMNLVNVSMPCTVKTCLFKTNIYI